MGKNKKKEKCVAVDFLITKKPFLTFLLKIGVVKKRLFKNLLNRKRLNIANEKGLNKHSFYFENSFIAFHLLFLIKFG